MSKLALHWKELRRSHPDCGVELKGDPGSRYYVAFTKKGQAIVDWSSFDALSAQGYLDGRCAKTKREREQRAEAKDPKDGYELLKDLSLGPYPIRGKAISGPQAVRIETKLLENPHHFGSRELPWRARTVEGPRNPSTRGCGATQAGAIEDLKANLDRLVAETGVIW